jgi:hypothetical protein
LNSGKPRGGLQNGHTSPPFRSPFDPTEHDRYAKLMPLEFLISVLLTVVVALIGGLLQLSIAPEMAFGVRAARGT